MAQDTYVVFNQSHCNAVLRVFPRIGDPGRMANYRFRRAIRESSVVINIVKNTSKDLVEETGLSIEELDDCPELRQLIKNGILRVIRKELKKEIEERLRKEAEELAHPKKPKGRPKGTMAEKILKRIQLQDEEAKKAK